MPKTFQSLLALVVLAIVGVFSVLAVMPPSPRGADAPKAEFSAARAFEHVRQMGKATHIAGSKANDEVRDYLIRTLRGMGLDPQIEEAIGVHANDDGGFEAARVRNVVTVIPGAQSSGRVFLVAHYDSVQTAPGANDDGAGVSAILEAVRAMMEEPNPRNDIVLLFTDAEEACLCGAQAFVEQHPLAKDGGVVLNVEARGSAGPAIMFETSAGNADVVGVYGAHAPYPVATSFAVEVYRLLPNDTDFTPFRVSGRFVGLNTAYIDGSAAYHTPQDLPERMDQRSLQHHGDNLLALTRAFSQADLAKLAKASGADASYFPAFGILVTYPAGLVWPLAILAMLGVIVLGWLSVRKGQTTIGRIAASTGLSLIPFILVPIAAQLIWLLVTTMQPGLANMIDPWQPSWLRWAVVATVAWIMIGWLVLLRRKLDAASIAIAGLAWLALFGVLTAAAVPGGSFMVAIPALAGAAAGIAALHVTGVWRLVVLAAGAAIGVIVLAPTVALSFPALGMATAGATAFVAVFLGLALLPMFEDAPWAGWAFRSAALVTTLLIGAHVAFGGFDAQRPMPTHLMYALDVDQASAFWASAEDEPSEWTAKFVSEQKTDVAGFPMLHNVWTGRADVANLPPAQVSVVSEETVGDDRRLSLRVQPQRDVRLVYLTLAGDDITVQGKAFPSREGRLALLFHAPPADGLEVTVVVRAGEKLTLEVTDGSDGLAALPGFRPRPQDVGVAGSHTSELVLVHKTYEL